ncbi:MAG: nucleotidyltransferase domain-containing protein [Nanoarchaeota archaeon]
MNKTLSRCVDRVLEEDSVDALYVYGSYVNGYYRDDSDIDLVALTSQNPKNKPIYRNASKHKCSFNTSFYFAII